MMRVAPDQRSASSRLQPPHNLQLSRHSNTAAKWEIGQRGVFGKHLPHSLSVLRRVKVGRSWLLSAASAANPGSDHHQTWLHSCNQAAKAKGKR